VPKVAVSIQSFPSYVACVFMDPKNTQRQLGPVRRFADEQRVFEMLRRAHADLETHHIVENALRQGNCCRVTLDLTDEQYEKVLR
jgi:hypothetical protein